MPVVGHAASISAGEYIHAVGVWINDRAHGPQFKADFLTTTPTPTAAGIEKYLGSGMVQGIGPKLAARIVAAFGVATFETIEATPEKLKVVSGIGEFRANGSRAEGRARHFSARAWRRTFASGAYLQDLWVRRHPDHDQSPPIGSPATFAGSAFARPTPWR
nr:helix-hairpin-helix domain-containing protein [Methylosinus trichosporium]